MKIVFLSDDFPPKSLGGAGMSTYDLAVGMRDAGQEVYVITTCRKINEAGASAYQGLTTFKVASDYPGRWRAWVSLYNPRVAREVKKILKRIRPDVVHANNIHQYLSYYCIQLARRYTSVVIFTARDAMAFSYGKLVTDRYIKMLDPRITWRDNLAQAGKRWNPLRNMCIRWLIARAHKRFAISEALQEALIKNGILDVDVIYNGIDLNAWSVSSSVVKRFKTKHNVAGKKVLLFSGRLSAAKGGEKAIEALARVTKTVPDAMLLVVGAVDAYAEAMRKKAQGLGIEHHLVFTGWIERNDLRAAYAAADVVLMPSICFDAFGRVNLEAMAAKKPVVGTCYGGVSEIVEDHVTGYIVNPFHTSEMADKIVTLLRDPAKTRSFGEAGYARAKTRFNLAEKVKAYLTTYERILKRI